MQRLTIPASFWMDHADRFAGHTGLCAVLSLRDRYARIEGTPEQLAFLKADATHYADPDATDCAPWLRKAARFTLFAINTVEG